MGHGERIVVTDVWGGFQKSADWAQGKVEGYQEKSAVADAFSGLSPEDKTDPTKQMSALMNASSTLMSKGYAKQGYELQKAASSLRTDAQTQQLNNLKLKTEQMSYAGQLISTAPTGDWGSLEKAVDAAELPTQVALGIRGEIEKAKNSGDPKAFDSLKERLKTSAMTLTEQQTKKYQDGELAAKVDKNVEDARKTSLEHSDKLATEARLREKQIAELPVELALKKAQTQKDIAESQATGKGYDMYTVGGVPYRFNKTTGVPEEITALAGKGDIAKVGGTGGAGGGLSGARSENVAGAVVELGRSMTQISKMDVGVTGGVFGDVKPGTGLFSAPLNLLGRAMTPEQDKQYIVAASNIGTALATIEMGGYKPQVTTIQMYQNKLTGKPSDSVLTKLYAIADAKEQAKTRANLTMANPKFPEAQKEVVKSAIAQMDKDYPFTPEDITYMQKHKMSIEQWIKEKGPKPSALPASPTSGSGTKEDPIKLH